MTKVGIVSSQTAKFRKSSNSSIFDLACEPCIHILKNNNLSKRDVEAIVFSSCSNEQYSSTIISEMLGLKPRISNRIDNLCNSGTNAIISAFSYIVSGLCDSVLVVGAEKANTMGSKLLWDVTRGSFNSPIHWAAIFANAHMRRYGTTEEQMAMVAVKNYTNAKKNPKALFGKKNITVSDVMKSRKIIDPLKLLDCSYLCDGASALLLMSEERAKKFTDSPIWIKGFGQQTSAASFSRVIDQPSMDAAKLAARDAFNMSKINSLSIDVAEVHDAFTILEILAYEDLGFIEEGEGGNFVNQDRIAINTRGGILGCGHSVGATGIAQTTEIVAQLSQKAGGRQVKGCKTGLVHNLAAAGTSATVIILGVD